MGSLPKQNGWGLSKEEPLSDYEARDFIVEGVGLWGDARAAGPWLQTAPQGKPWSLGEIT